MSNSDQADYWTGQAGWVEQQDKLDATLAPVLDLLLAKSALTPNDRVLDIGCGTGASTIAAASSAGYVTGLDISPTLLACAKTRTSHVQNIDLIQADAQTYAFDTPFDVVISRFGVMFFEDTVAAFQNILYNMKPGGRIIMAAWGPPHQNPWFMEPAAVASAHLGDPPKTDRTLPGPFAFEDAPRVLDLLTKAGVKNPACDAVTVHLTAGPLMQAAELCTHIGPAKRALGHFNGSEPVRIAIRDGIMDVFTKYDRPNGLQIPAVINLFTGHAAG
ncbi:class I SAM-dependent methyltransferase [Parasulfitobacter algicola]|uniref:Methyltransferase domain-containing protein n=1 Tax=Parasulfitobacter algicola TaxID=2614809 RepID=A0ABX2IQJ7_9RHOB|nr:class I SAM-dependent methyltransferase [Sulfitobacter algicola]NSX55144.1 methyltransferase domain-containing protein [Sulfitobacter algicola]